MNMTLVEPSIDVPKVPTTNLYWFSAYW